MKVGFVSRTFGHWHGIGPWLYWERGNFSLHIFARYFRLPYHRGFHWRLALRLGWRGNGHYVIYVGR